MSSLTGLSPNNPSKYLGPNVALAVVVTRDRAPTGADYRQPETGKLYPFNTFWLVGKNPTTGIQGDLWYLSKIVANVAYWIQITFGGNGDLFSLSDNNNDVTYPTLITDTPPLNIQIQTDNTTVEFISGTNTLVQDFGITNLILGDSCTSITTASGNSGYGLNVLQDLDTANSNSIFGAAAGRNITSSSGNCIYGFLSGSSLTTGNGGNTLIGYASGASLINGTLNICIGINSGVTLSGIESQNIIIGNLGVAGDNNTTRIGTFQTQAFMAGIYNTTPAGGTTQNVIIDSNGQLGTGGSGFDQNYTATPISYQVLVTDYIVGVTSTAAARTITMPNTGMTVGQSWTIKDESGAAVVNNITVSGNGANIDGAASYPINTNYGSITLYWNGTNFFIK